MKRRWPSVLMVGSTRLGLRKLIDLLSKAVEAEVHHSGDITLVIIRGRYTYTVRERAAVPEDAIAVIADKVVARELEYLINDSATAVERPLVIRSLEEGQVSTDGLSYDVKGRVMKGLLEHQQSNDGIFYDTSERTLKTFEEVQSTEESSTHLTFSRQSTSTNEYLFTDEVSCGESAALHSSFVEGLAPEDAFSYETSTVVRLDFDESAPASESISVVTPTVQRLAFHEKQASDDIPAGYVPQGDETLVIRAFADSVYASDRLLYQKGAYSALAEEQASVDSISIEIEQAIIAWPMFHHDPQHTGVADAHNVIYVGSDDYYLHALNPDGSLKWKYQTGSIVNSSPAVAPDGTIYVGSSDYYLYALNPDGSLKWKYQTGIGCGLPRPSSKGGGERWCISAQGVGRSLRPAPSSSTAGFTARTAPTSWTTSSTTTWPAT